MVQYSMTICERRVITSFSNSFIHEIWSLLYEYHRDDLYMYINAKARGTITAEIHEIVIFIVLECLIIIF